jgi:hypothetical protein
MERAFAAPAPAHGNTMERRIIRVDSKIDVTIAIERPVNTPSNKHVDLDMPIRFR